MNISLLGRQVAVLTVSAESLSRITNDSNSIGYFDGKSIYLLNTLEGETKNRVLTHEVVHAILNISGLSNLLEDNLEEAICDAMESLDAHVSFRV